MVKRARVSTALHSELTEYASLLRAIRTRETLDLSSQLTQYKQSRHASTSVRTDPGDSDSDLEEFQAEGTGLQSPHMATSPPLTSEVDRKTDASPSHDTAQESRRKSRGKGKAARTNDTWTRWPLLAGDVHIPEWGLDEEVRLIASQALHESKAAEPPDALDSDVRSESSDADSIDVEPSLSPIFLKALASSTAAHLSQILSLLAFHTPLVEKSLQNRLAAVGWVQVLNAVSAAGSVAPTVIQRVRTRLEAIYGPRPEATSHDRSLLVQASKRKLDELTARLEDGDDAGLLSFHGPKPVSMPSRPKKRTRKGALAEKPKSKTDQPTATQGNCFDI